MNQFMHILADEFVNAFIGQKRRRHAGLQKVQRPSRSTSIKSLSAAEFEQYAECYPHSRAVHLPPAYGRDVRHHAYHIQHPAILIEEGLRVFLQPNNRTIVRSTR